MYDPDGAILPHIVNRESIVAPGIGTPDAARQALTHSVHSIRMAAPSRAQRNKGVFLEVATIDGAVVFDDAGVTAFGAMIATQPDVGPQAGARSTAAQSALLWGGRPVKISSDGEITFLFRVDGYPTRLEFL